MTNKLGMDDDHYNYKHMQQDGEDLYATLSSPPSINSMPG